VLFPEFDDYSLNELITGKVLECKFSNEGFISGHDFAGIVEEVGSDTGNVKRGDRLRLVEFMQNNPPTYNSYQVAGWSHGISLRAGHGTFSQFVHIDGRIFSEFLTTSRLMKVQLTVLSSKQPL
jgi:threonine dehydrogenase-like Zn-dependent dehydrogenase